MSELALDLFNALSKINKLQARINKLETAGAKLADASQDLINALPLDFSNWEIVPVHKALLEWNEINKENKK